MFIEFDGCLINVNRVDYFITDNYKDWENNKEITVHLIEAVYSEDRRIREGYDSLEKAEKRYKELSKILIKGE